MTAAEREGRDRLAWYWRTRRAYLRAPEDTRAVARGRWWGAERELGRWVRAHGPAVGRRLLARMDPDEGLSVVRLISPRRARRASRPLATPR